MQSNLQYRPEIDGLRAIAVMAVVLYHSDINLLSGGFLGVDIFFVISGYLITAILHRDLNSKGFSMVHFYERRVRRILPVLLFVIFITIPFAWIWLMPSDLKDFSQSLISILLLSSNVLFLKESGYFEVSAELKPFIHTWSLSIEEQFYLVFPVLFALAYHKVNRLLLSILSTTCVIGFVSSFIIGNFNQDFAFYMIFTRAWELLFGAICFFWRQKVTAWTSFLRFNYRVLQGLICYFGLILIVISLIGNSKWTSYPEVVLPSIIGTGLILIFIDKNTSLRRFLSFRPLVFIGLISYSVYLWHQPILAIASHRTLDKLNLMQSLGLLTLTFAVGTLSWKYIEKPFRDKSIVKRRLLLRYVGISYLVIFLIGAVGHLTDGRSSLHGDRWKLVNEKIYEPNYGLGAECDANFKKQPRCSNSENPEILIWGDSFAMHLVSGILASNPQARVIQETNSNCAPILGLAALTPGISENFALNCIKSNDRILKDLASQESVKFVVLSSSLRGLFDDRSSVLRRDLSIAGNDGEILDDMVNTLKAIRDLKKTPIIFSPTPVNGEDLGRCTKKAIFFGKSLRECDFDLSQSKKFQQNEVSFLKSLENIVTVVWLKDGICDEQSICKVSQNGVIMYRDSGHLTMEGSALLGKKMNFYSLITNVS